MAIYRVAICDDLARDRQCMMEITAALLRENGIPYQIEPFPAAAALLAAREQGAGWDLILLDIMMDGQDGIALAGALRAKEDKTDLIFITGSPEYALAGYQSYPVSYLLKPLTKESLRPVLGRCLEKYRKDPVLVLEAPEGGKRTFRQKDIFFVEVFRRELVVHGKEGTVSCVGGLGAAMEKLSQKQFYRCHRSFAVNLAYVRGIQRYQFLLAGGETVPIAMRGYAQAQARWLAFLQ